MRRCRYSPVESTSLKPSGSAIKRHLLVPSRTHPPRPALFFDSRLPAGREAGGEDLGVWSLPRGASQYDRAEARRCIVRVQPLGALEVPDHRIGEWRRDDLVEYLERPLRQN